MLVTSSIKSTWRSSKLDECLLDEQGRLQVVDAAVLAAVPSTELRLWAARNGVFQFITTEMIEWLAPYFEGKSGLEICAGKGALGRALGIPSTDSMLLQGGDPYVKQMMEKLGEEPTNPPADVLKFEANKAVDHFRPQVVVGAFVTQLTLPGENWHKIPGSAYGTDEEALLKKVQTYIMFGNLNTHKKKRLFKKKHSEYAFPWLINRCADQSLNRVWVWHR